MEWIVYYYNNITYNSGFFNYFSGKVTYNFSYPNIGNYTVELVCHSGVYINPCSSTSVYLAVGQPTVPNVNWDGYEFSVTNSGVLQPIYTVSAKFLIPSTSAPSSIQTMATASSAWIGLSSQQGGNGGLIQCGWTSVASYWGMQVLPYHIFLWTEIFSTNSAQNVPTSIVYGINQNLAGDTIYAKITGNGQIWYMTLSDLNKGFNKTYTFTDVETPHYAQIVYETPAFYFFTFNGKNYYQIAQSDTFSSCNANSIHAQFSGTGTLAVTTYVLYQYQPVGTYPPTVSFSGSYNINSGTVTGSETWTWNNDEYNLPLVGI